VATRASLLALLVPMPGSSHPPFPLVAEISLDGLPQTPLQAHLQTSLQIRNCFE
jgi:hypothetical protein